MFVPYASELWTKSYGPNYTKILAFRHKKKKKVFFNHFWQRVDAILEEDSVAEIIFWC